MKIFFGAAIQGASNREERAAVHRLIISALKENRCEVISEHTTGRDYQSTIGLLEEKLGSLPPRGLDRTILIRNKMIEFIEGDIDAAIFEVSAPSLGTGIEIAHAYLRPRMGLPEIPVIALYQNGYWPNDLSTMIKGITAKEVSNFRLKRYDDPKQAPAFIKEILADFKFRKIVD